ncbi:alpha/beta hydrolase, partial [Gordonia sp. NPDC003585]
RALIDQADDVVAEADRILTAIRDGRISARAASNVADALQIGATQGGLVPAPPPKGATPAAVRADWDALPADQQRALIATHPEWLGNAPGIPSDVRHEVNLSRLAGVRSHLREVRDRMRKQVDRHLFGGLFTNEDAGLKQVERKIADVERLQELIGDKPWSRQNPDGRMLLLLDMASGEQGKAAVAIGNPDDADHVSVTTPGMDTNIRDSFPGAMGEIESLRDEAYRQLRLTPGRHGETVSTIMWLGYEPPDNRGTRLPGWSFFEVAQQDRATNGAPDLVEFYRGLDATSNKDDPHLSAFGHSYGSLTQGIALQQPGGHPIDDAAFYGSPGFEAGTEAELGLAPGHGFVMQGDRDWIAKFQTRKRFGLNGPAPLTTNLRRLDVNPRTTPDGIEREGAHTHADYPRNGSNWQLRVSGYHLARILAGLPPD